MLILIAASMLGMVVAGTSDAIQGTYWWVVVFLVCCGTMDYAESSKFLLQNGMSRKGIFVSTIAMFALAALFIACADGLLQMVWPSWSDQTAFGAAGYNVAYGFPSFIWTVLLNPWWG